MRQQNISDLFFIQDISTFLYAFQRYSSVVRRRITDHRDSQNTSLLADVVQINPILFPYASLNIRPILPRILPGRVVNTLVFSRGTTHSISAPIATRTHFIVSTSQNISVLVGP